jgi:hypothetical protein
LPVFENNKGWHCTYADFLSNILLNIDINFVESDDAKLRKFRELLEDR